MNTEELNEKTGNNNEDEMSEDIENQNCVEELKAELTNRELDRIIDNIPSGNSRDQIPQLHNDENVNPACDQSNLLDADNILTATDTPSPNDDSESQDEDLLLRWDEDEDDETSNQEKIDENIFNELDSLDNSIKTDSNLVCDNIDSENIIKADDTSSKYNDIIEECDKGVPSKSEDLATDVLHEKAEISRKDLTTNAGNNLIDNITLNVYPTNDVESRVLGNDKKSSNPADSENVSDQISDIDFHKNVDSIGPKESYDKTIIKYESNDELTGFPNDELHTSSIRALNPVIKDEFEENEDDDNIDFLKQQLKVLSESINPNLNTHTIDVSNILSQEYAANAGTSVIDALDGFGEDVPMEDSKCSVSEIDVKPRQGVDVDDLSRNNDDEKDTNDRSKELDTQYDDASIVTENVMDLGVNILSGNHNDEKETNDQSKEPVIQHDDASNGKKNVMDLGLGVDILSGNADDDDEKDTNDRSKKLEIQHEDGSIVKENVMDLGVNIISGNDDDKKETNDQSKGPDIQHDDASIGKENVMDLGVGVDILSGNDDDEKDTNDRSKEMDIQHDDASIFKQNVMDVGVDVDILLENDNDEKDTNDQSEKLVVQHDDLSIVKDHDVMGGSKMAIDFESKETGQSIFNENANPIIGHIQIESPITDIKMKPSEEITVTTFETTNIDATINHTTKEDTPPLETKQSEVIKPFVTEATYAQNICNQADKTTCDMNMKSLEEEMEVDISKLTTIKTETVIKTDESINDIETKNAQLDIFEARDVELAAAKTKDILHEVNIKPPEEEIKKESIESTDSLLTTVIKTEANLNDNKMKILEEHKKELEKLDIAKVTYIEETAENITEKKVEIKRTTSEKVLDVDISEAKILEENIKELKKPDIDKVPNMEKTTGIKQEKNIEIKTTTSKEALDLDISEAIEMETLDNDIEKCDNYIDLRSQSPISLDNEPLDTDTILEDTDPKISPRKDLTENKIVTESVSKDSLNYYNVKTDHRLKPDVMIEIPTQNLIDVDDIDESIDIDSEETSQDAETKVEEPEPNKIEEKRDVEENKEKQPSLRQQVKILSTGAIHKTDEISTNISDIIDVDMDEDSNEETPKDPQLDKSIKDILNSEREAESIPIKEDKESKEPKKSVFNEEENDMKVTSTNDNDENIIDLDDYDTSDALDSSEQPPILTDPKNDKKSSDEVTEDVQPSTSSEYVRRMTPDESDELPDESDSLGLLAESSRVRREEDAEEDFDEDDDFDQEDESSSQMTAEHSEDSNAHHSEPDSKEQEDKSPAAMRSFNFAVCEVVGAVTKEKMVGSSVDAASKPVIEASSDEHTDLEAKEQKEKDDSNAADIETVKLSDTSDNEAEPVKKDQKKEVVTPEKTVPSPSKTKNLGIAKPRHVVNIVDLEESSSEDDVQETPKESSQGEVGPQDKEQEVPSDVTCVNIPTEIEIMSNSCGSTSEIVTKQGEVVITGVPKPPPHRPARLNTSEVTIKTAPASSESSLIIPETKMAESSQKPKAGLEIFNLDSDDDDIDSSSEGSCGEKLTALELDEALRAGRCLRRGCDADARGKGAGALARYCHQCAAQHYQRTQDLVKGIKSMTPLLELNMEKVSQELVEISDSDSEQELEASKRKIGEAGAKMLEENLADIINSMWRKYKMDASLVDAKALLDAEMERLENESKEINKMLNDCQTATDRLRSDLYATFEPPKKELPALIIWDTQDGAFSALEKDLVNDQNAVPELKPGKRRLSITNTYPAKRPAIPLGYAPLDTETPQAGQQEHTTVLRAGEFVDRLEDDKEVSVVQLSAEAAPADLPPPGEPQRAPLRPAMHVYAMRNAFGAWLKARILETVKLPGLQSQFPSFRVRFEHKVKNPCKVLSARCLAYPDAADVRLTIGTRVIALFKEAANVNKRESYYSGIVAEIPNPVNNYRYLVFFDDGYAQYASHCHTRVVCASAAPVWEEVHPFSREFVRNYLCAYPERPMVRLHAGQKLNTEWNGKWWESRVIQVDASLVQVYFEEDNRTEWIYRGSTRLEPLFLELQAAVKHRGRHVPRSKAQISINMPYVEYTRSYEQDKSIDAQQEELRRQRAVAKKSTTLAMPGVQDGPDPFASRVVYYTPRNAVRPYKMVTHTCGPKCKRSDVLTLKELRSYNPLAKPLLSGWERQLVRHRGAAAVLYRAPCGRRVRSARELHRYLRATRSDVPVDLFDFHPDTHCLAEFVLSKCIVGKKDLSHGKENVPVPCVNSVDDSLPEFCSYNTERTPTAGVPLNLDPEFLCGCDCTDDCEDKSKCACWKLTLEGAKTIGMEGANIGYDYKRLLEPLPSGIYECNVRCKCKHTCLNRVAQHPLQLKLQVFKTPNRGWGIRALNDVPKGAFLCVYAGNLLTDATANLDGLNEGDEYLAELDYIEVVEQMKEGYEEDVPEADKLLDQKSTEKKAEKSEEEEESSSDEDEKVSKNEEQDDDFRPGYIGLGVMDFNKRLRKRGKEKKDDKDEQKEEQEKEKEKEPNADDDCITISDDEEVREPSRFAAQAEMGANEHVPKYRSVRSYFGKDEACYIMDAKVQGNIGRYLNHSCSPNVFVQNVFVDTHDPRFPWVAFFALSHIRAGTELTWNYNYDVGSVPGKVLYCYCGAPNCRRRLL